MSGLRCGSVIVAIRRRSLEPVTQVYVSQARVATDAAPTRTVSAEAKDADQKPDTIVTRWPSICAW